MSHATKANVEGMPRKWQVQHNKASYNTIARYSRRAQHGAACFHARGDSTLLFMVRHKGGERESAPVGLRRAVVVCAHERSRSTAEEGRSACR